MKISGSHEIPAAPEHAYRLLQDPEVLAACIPGCERLERAGQDLYEMKMKMVLAAISGNFDGKVRLADQNPPSSFRLLVEGTGKIGFVKGDGLLKLAAAPAGTTVSYEGEVQVGGTIASVGQRLLDITSKMLIRKFFEKLGEKAAPKQE